MIAKLFDLFKSTGNERDWMQSAREFGAGPLRIRPAGELSLRLGKCPDSSYDQQRRGC
jgi:hypothetical protein